MMIHRLSSSSLYVGKTKCVCVHKLPRFFSIQLKLVFLDAGQQQLACPLFSFCDSFEKFSANYLSKEEETRATVRLLIPFVSPYLFRYWGGGTPDEVNPSFRSFETEEDGCLLSIRTASLLFLFPIFLCFSGLSQGDRMHWSPTVPPP